jgi:hypothetical protein
MAAYAFEIAKRFQQYKQYFDSEIQKAEELEAHARAIKARIGAQKERTDQGLPAPDACPECWVQSGKKVIVVPKLSPEHDKFDRWACPNCSWHFDVLTR